MLKKDIIVGSVSNGVTVLDNKIVVAELCETSNHLLRNIGLLVDGQCKVQVMRLGEISQLL
jgi:hypothetical protein